MRSAVLRKDRVVVDEVPEPVPALGQVLVRVLACGICGSDLHFVTHGRRVAELTRDAVLSTPLDFDRDIFLGHEFAAEVLDVGPDTIGPAKGTIVTSLPVMLTLDGVVPMAYSNDYPGGYSERMLLSAPLCLPVPNGLDPNHAALTEPLAVGLHAVAKAQMEPGDAALVLGCGPVGLAVVAGLRLAGVTTIVAADYSPARRLLATSLGAGRTVDPAREEPIEAWREVDGRRPLVIFEAVGVPGMLDRAVRDAPVGGRVLVVGACMETDHILPLIAIGKELTIQFALAYTPEEFAAALRHLAEGDVDPAPLITGTVELDGVADAFGQLALPDRHCKILVTP
jgi:threonine dehydrogenase-like Zn-dependent dehydrogenase